MSISASNASKRCALQDQQQSTSVCPEELVWVYVIQYEQLHEEHLTAHSVNVLVPQRSQSTPSISRFLYYKLHHTYKHKCACVCICPPCCAHVNISAWQNEAW